jgi:single-stranded DNA-binding protein
MCTGFLLGDVEFRGEEEQQPLPLGIVAFGKQADILAKHAKGQFLTVSGRLQGQLYDGQVRYSVVADSIVSARAVQPGAKPTTQQAMDSYQKLYKGAAQ